MIVFSGYMISNININFNPEKATSFEDLVSITKGADREVGNAEYIPVTANENSDDLTLYNIHEKNVSIPFTQDGSEITFEYNDNNNEFEVNIPLIYYKGYEAQIEDKNGNVTELEVVHNTENGHVLIKGDKQLSGTVEIKYRMTLVQKICYTISWLTFAAILGYIIYKQFKNKE